MSSGAQSFLRQGDDGVLRGPIVDFTGELRRMKLPADGFEATRSDSETADLIGALNKAGVAAEQGKVLDQLAEARKQLSEFDSAKEQWEDSRPWIDDGDGQGHRGDPQLPAPKFPKLIISEKMPAEFAEYLNGAFVWRNPALADKGPAREAWERVLALPPAQRRNKSTWAAFMLGKYWESKDPDKAARYFQQVRELNQRGFSDSTGLAAASLGLEARVYLNQKKFKEAIAAYLEQFGAGDDSAAQSLRITARVAVQSPAEALEALAQEPRCRAIVSTYLISRRGIPDLDDEERSRLQSQAISWVNAALRAGVTDSDSAEKLALIAYENGEFAAAMDWADAAAKSPVAKWVRAKVILRSGKITQARDLLLSIVDLFPDPPDQGDARDFVDSLFMERGMRPLRKEIFGEIGMLQLSLGEYSQALDSFLRADSWIDAAYVAERVLTLDELKAYVDASWPAEPTTSAGESATVEQNSNGPSKERIRHLLARRLTRSLRGDEAAPYYPEKLLPQFQELAAALRAGWNDDLSLEERRASLFNAATLARKNGMELLGTEIEPDWAASDGDSRSSLVEDRATNSSLARLVAARPDEIHRAREHHPDPDVRFHYRYQAAFLAWEAAKLMPNDSDQTAFVLWQAGAWLKNRDPETADIFYKALVRRNHKTALGAAADSQRWFPELNTNGEPLPRHPKETSIQEQNDSTVTEAAVDPPIDTTATSVDPQPQ